jgi:hypothetical protein
MRANCLLACLLGSIFREDFMTIPPRDEGLPFRRMKNRWLLQLRLTLSTAAAVFFLAESLNTDFLRAASGSRTIFVHVCIAIFGAAWAVQSFVLIRQLRGEDLQ